MDQNTTDKINGLFNGIPWKPIFKDAAKFYIYLIIFYGLTFLLVWGQAYLSLENYKMSIDDALSAPLATGTETKEFDFKTHETIARKMGTYMFILICFGVFFTIPPKTFKHAAIVTALISVTANLPFLYETFTEWLYDNLYLCGNILAAWLCSHMWFRLISKNNA